MAQQHLNHAYIGVAQVLSERNRIGKGRMLAEECELAALM
jgi:hypothetical protein